MTSDAHDHLRRDPELQPLVDRHGELTLEPADDPFQRFVTSIVNQQLSTDSATAIRERLFDRFEVDPEGMLAADEAALRDVGLSEQKITYVRNVAAEYRDGRLSRDRLDGMSDEAVVDELTDIHGIGRWTAKMFLMFVLGREDVFPVEDLGIRRGMELLYGDLTRAEMSDRATEWTPYRSIASLYLWREYESRDATVGTPGL